jgi:hypothetical protein
LGDAMAKRKVISGKFLPVLPGRALWTAMVAWLYMDRFKVVLWIQAVILTLYAIVFIGLIAMSYDQKEFEPELKQETFEG